MMKKTIASLSVAALLALVPLTAGAQNAVCPVEYCNRTVEHTHDGVTYSGHYAGDGHNRSVCNVAGCTKTGSHQHNGKTCLPHNSADGHGYHKGGNANGYKYHNNSGGHRGGHH